MSSISETKIFKETSDNIIKEEETFPENEIYEENCLSNLSFSSYNSINNIKLENMGQYTCDQCSEIPKIISTNIKNNTILIECRNHGLKELNINNYLLNSLNYNPHNWVCTKSQNIQKNTEEKFKYCECGSVFCEGCFKVHQLKISHNNYIDSDKYYLRCKENPEHFDEPFKGYCYECNKNYCKKCENNHKNHNVILINSMQIKPEEIEEIKKVNKEYRKIISYYEGLIRLNNLIIYSYKNYRDNYYNLFNMNTIIKNIQRKNIIPLNDDNIKELLPEEKKANNIHYINNLYQQQLKEAETVSVKIDNKFLNNYDLKILTQIPLHNLKTLELDNNNISKIDYLEYADFPELVVLSLKNNSIEDISIFERVKFKDIQALFLSNNNISDINVLANTKFNKLRLIDLKNNKINDIGVFESFGKEKLNILQCIYLSGNKYDLNKFNGIKTILEKCDEYVL